MLRLSLRRQQTFSPRKIISRQYGLDRRTIAAQLSECSAIGYARRAHDKQIADASARTRIGRRSISLRRPAICLAERSRLSDNCGMGEESQPNRHNAQSTSLRNE